MPHRRRAFPTILAIFCVLPGVGTSAGVASAEPTSDAPVLMGEPPTSVARGVCKWRRQADALARQPDASEDRRAWSLMQARHRCDAKLLLSCSEGLRVMQGDRGLPCGEPVALEAAVGLELEAFDGNRKIGDTMVYLPGSETTAMRVERKGEGEVDWVQTSAPIEGFDPREFEQEGKLAGYLAIGAGVFLAGLGVFPLVEGYGAEPTNADEQRRSTLARAFGWLCVGAGATLGASGVYVLHANPVPRLELPRTGRGSAPAANSPSVWAAPLGGAAWGGIAGMSW